MLRAAFASGLERCEFLGADDPYELEWTETRHDFVRLHAFSRSPAGRASRVAWERGRPLLQRLRAAKQD